MSYRSREKEFGIKSLESVMKAAAIQRKESSSQEAVRHGGYVLITVLPNLFGGAVQKAMETLASLPPECSGLSRDVSLL